MSLGGREGNFCEDGSAGGADWSRLVLTGTVKREAPLYQQQRHGDTETETETETKQQCARVRLCEFVSPVDGETQRTRAPSVLATGTDTQRQRQQSDSARARARQTPWTRGPSVQRQRQRDTEAEAAKRQCARARAVCARPRGRGFAEHQAGHVVLELHRQEPVLVLARPCRRGPEREQVCPIEGTKHLSLAFGAG